MIRYPVDGRVALITGAAGGIGLGTARALHARGASVVLSDLDGDAVRRAAGSVSDERTLGVVADVTDRAALDAAVAVAVERFGGLDIVVANAGVASTPATVRTIDETDFQRTVGVDMFGVWHTVRAALPQIIERRGHVVVISSIYAFAPGLMMTPYAMAKAGVEQLGRALRIELAPHGAGASVAYFGFVDTPMVRDSLRDPRAAEFISHVPWWLRRRLTAEEAGEALARGIERRAPRIIAPKGWAFLRATRGISDALADRFILRHREVMTLLDQADDPERRSADQATLALVHDQPEGDRLESSGPRSERCHPRRP
jgi:NAD(P)-dependent dehydrogenase (short-subunit alcohol dehydrogenase family)